MTADPSDPPEASKPLDLYEKEATLLQEDWQSPPDLPISERQRLILFLAGPQSDASDDQLVGERYGDRYAVAQSSMTKKVVRGIPAIDLFAATRSGKARDEADTLAKLRRFPAWTLEYGALIINGYLVEEKLCRSAIRKLKQQSDEFPERKRILDTYNMLFEAFSPDHEAPPGRILHVAAAMAPHPNGQFQTYLWEMTSILARELRRRQKNEGWWEGQRKNLLTALKRRAAKSSMIRRSEALVWLLAKELWPEHEGNLAARESAIFTLAKESAGNDGKALARLAVSKDSVGSVLERGSQAWGEKASNGAKGPKSNMGG